MSSGPTPVNKKDFLQVIGDYGPYQRRVFILLFLFHSLGEWQNFVITFMTPNIDFQCASPNDVNHTEPVWDRSPINAGEWSSYNDSGRCHVAVSPNSTLEWADDDISTSETTMVPCTKWDYDERFYQRTIISEWDLVCENEWLISLAKSVYMVGYLISSFVFGQMADSVGRYPTIIVCYFLMLFAAVLTAFSQSYLMFVILRFLQACGTTGLTVTGYVLMMEVIGPEKRTFLGIVVLIGLSVGFVTLPALAWIVRPWMWLQLAASVPLIPLVCVCCLITESPRWLGARGKVPELEKVLTRAGALNDRPQAFSAADLIEPGNDEKQKKDGSIVDLMKSPRMRRRVMCMAYIWFVNVFVYYNLVYNTNDLAGNPHLNFFLSSVMEFPSYLSVYYAICKIGRKQSLIAAMVTAGASCAAMVAVPSRLSWLSITFAMIGRFCINGTIGILYLYTAEMFPTVVRNTAVGLCSTLARVGSILAPFTRELAASTHPTVPNGLNAFLAILSAIVVIFLPETKGQKMPDTLEEGENFKGGTKHKESDYKINISVIELENCKNENTRL